MHIFAKDLVKLKDVHCFEDLHILYYYAYFEGKLFCDIYTKYNLLLNLTFTHQEVSTVARKLVKKLHFNVLKKFLKKKCDPMDITQLCHV